MPTRGPRRPDYLSGRGRPLPVDKALHSAVIQAQIGFLPAVC